MPKWESFLATEMRKFIAMTPEAGGWGLVYQVIWERKSGMDTGQPGFELWLGVSQVISIYLSLATSLCLRPYLVKGFAISIHTESPSLGLGRCSVGRISHCASWRSEFGDRHPQAESHNLLKLQPQRTRHPLLDCWHTHVCLPTKSNVYTHTQHIHTQTYTHTILKSNKLNK